jgi:hypothetical protein
MHRCPSSLPALLRASSAEGHASASCTSAPTTCQSDHPHPSRQGLLQPRVLRRVSVSPPITILGPLRGSHQRREAPTAPAATPPPARRRGAGRPTLGQVVRDQASLRTAERRRPGAGGRAIATWRANRCIQRLPCRRLAPECTVGVHAAPHESESRLMNWQAAVGPALRGLHCLHEL